VRGLYRISFSVEVLGYQLAQFHIVIHQKDRGTAGSRRGRREFFSEHHSDINDPANKGQ
jgi:hypothetical protein